MEQPKELSIEQLFDYLQCPLRYHMKHERHIEVRTKDAVQGIAYKEAFHHTLFFYYNSMQQGRIPTLKQMYEKFAKLWHEKSDIAMEGVLVEDLSQSTREARIRKEKYLHNGYKLIQRFYQSEKKKEQTPIAVNHPYRIAVGDVVVTGSFELIRERLDNESPTRFIEVVDFRTSTRKPEGFFLRHDLHATFMHYAFLSVFGKKPDYFVLDYVGASEEIVFERSQNDYKRMLSAVKGAANGISGGDIYPRQGLHCKQCPVRDACDRWEF